MTSRTETWKAKSLTASSALDVVHGRLDPYGLRYSVEGLLAAPTKVQGLEGWEANGNRLFLAPGVDQPEIVYPGDQPPPTNAIIAIASHSNVKRLVIWGDAPVMCFGYSVQLPDSRLACGGGSTVVINDGVSAADWAKINCRNGGLIFAGTGGLWSESVTLFSDDMHTICDAATGERVNPHGGKIIIEDHVWLGFESMIIRSARVGHDCVVGARAFVTADIPPNSVCGGSPARVLRSGISWNGADIVPAR